MVALQGDISAALVAYRGALQVSPQRELQLLALHEVAWCHLLQLNWVHAQGAFANLKRESRWSKSFYAYISAGKSRRQCSMLCQICTCVVGLFRDITLIISLID